MSKTRNDRGRLAEERGRALLRILLTNRKDLIVRDVAGEEMELDFMVSIQDDAKIGVRQFGVELKASLSLPDEERLSDWVKVALAQVCGEGPFPFPVILVIVEMEKSRIYYSWVAQPIETDRGYKLALPLKPTIEPLDDQRLEDVIDLVHRWYDDFYS